MFVDKVKINVKAGKGGDGMVAFRREKYVPNGGPAGGDGGRGGSIILRVDEGLRTLMDFRYHHIFKAKPGQNGMPKGMYGKKAADLVIAVPAGTTVTDVDSGEVLGDLTKPNEELVVAKGGRGGRGNIHFASAKNPAPEIAENGEPGVERNLALELKVLADVGLVGFPSVGKSTLLSAVTKAKPKIAAYHFTTLVPNLGMVQLDDGRDFVMADLPGLIEGAASGVGLGIQFLRHVERTRVILHVVDMADISSEGRDAFDDFVKINHELKKYNPDLLKRPQIVVASKMDMPDAQANLEEFKEKLNSAQADNDAKVVVKAICPISAVTHQGLDMLVKTAANLLDQTPQFTLVKPQATTTAAKAEPEFTLSRDSDATWVLGGAKLMKLFKMTNLDHDESLMRFARQLRAMGVDDALRAKGAHAGDLVRIGSYTFEFVE